MAAKKPRLSAPKSKYGKTLTFKGGPWNKQEGILPVQPDTDPMSMWIHVGKHVGRYNMNTGVWTPKEKTE